MTLQLHYRVFTPKDTDVVKRRAICTPMFIAAMAMVAKLWKEPLKMERTVEDALQWTNG